MCSLKFVQSENSIEILQDALIIHYFRINNYFFWKKIYTITCLNSKNLFTFCPIVYL